MKVPIFFFFDIKMSNYQNWVNTRLIPLTIGLVQNEVEIVFYQIDVTDLSRMNHLLAVIYALVKKVHMSLVSYHKKEKKK